MSWHVTYAEIASCLYTYTYLISDDNYCNRTHINNDCTTQAAHVSIIHICITSHVYTIHVVSCICYIYIAG